MEKIQVTARFKIHKGKLNEFKGEGKWIFEINANQDLHR